MTDDELTPFRDDPLLRALRAPAQDHELAGEGAAAAMFRTSLPARRRRRRALTRIGVGGAGVVLGLALTGGVAAAYTTGLPDPVQDVVHSAIDPLPLPAPPSARVRHLRQLRHAVAAAAAAARHRERARAQATPTGRASEAPRPDPTPQVVGPPMGAGASPRASVSASPTTAPPRPTMTVAVSRRVVPVHGSVVLSGRLTRGTDGLPGRLVYAAELPAGDSTWHRVTSGRTSSDGSISLTVSPLTSNVRLRLVTGQGVTSRQLPVAVLPKLAANSTRSGNQRLVTVAADGGRPGDSLVLLRRDGDAWTRIGSTSLGSDGTGQFVVPGPGASRVRYLVRLPATSQHAASVVQFFVPAR